MVCGRKKIFFGVHFEFRFWNFFDEVFYSEMGCLCFRIYIHVKK